MEKIKNIIENAFPSLKVTAIESIGKGWNSAAYRINREYVFRFPRHADASEMIQREICLLPKIESRLNLSVPHIGFIGKPTKEFDKYFVGYKEIRGVELNGESFDKLSDNSKDNLTQALVEFLSILHKTRLEDIETCNLRRRDFKADYASAIKEAEESVFPLLSSQEGNCVRKLYDDYLNESDNFEYIPVLLHNDLSIGHVIFDERTQEISGIIDWGDIGIGDPDYDLMYLYDDLGEVFIKRLLKYHNNEDHATLFRKLRFFQFADKLDSIMLAKERNYPDKIHAALKSVKEKIAQMN
jgi:aminoglycoside 2''-phosphotransferase